MEQQQDQNLTIQRLGFNKACFFHHLRQQSGRRQLYQNIEHELFNHLWLNI
jgi:hypothetical protein